MSRMPMDNSSQTGKTVLFISELPDNILNADLESFFADYKDNIIMFQVDANSRPIDFLSTRKPKATIIFKDSAKAAEARNNLNMKKLKGKTLNIMWHEKNNSLRYNNEANIFVKGIPSSVTPRNVYEVFSQYGEIISSKIGEDEEGNNLGYGYFNYYSIDSAEKAIKDLNGKEMWGGVLEISHFQKKNERLQSYLGNTSLYVKCFPSEYGEKEVSDLFKDFGKITLTKVEKDTNTDRKFAIVVFDSPENAVKAKDAMNGMKIGKEELFVDLHQKKADRKRYISSKIREINSKLNQDYKNCNLYIKNLPKDLDEEKLKEIFSKYGEIKSVKIQKYLLETKINNEKAEILCSAGFGFVCFKNQESAQKAKQELNEKYLPGYENDKHPPVIINDFMPRYERKQLLSQLQESTPKFPLPQINPQMMMMPPMYRGQYVAFPPNVRYPPQNRPSPHYNNNPMRKNPHNNPNMHYPNKQPMNFQPPKTNEPTPVQRNDEPNLKYLDSIDSNDQKKDYLGEFLFKKIEQHPIAHEKSLTIDVIGKITGMILGIDDIKEIYEIITNYDNLTSRIHEALELLNGQNA